MRLEQIQGDRRVGYLAWLLMAMVLTASVQADTPLPPGGKGKQPKDAAMPGSEQLLSANDEIAELSKRALRGQDFTVSNRNPFASSYSGVNTPKGTYTAQGIWQYITDHLPLVGVNIDDENQKASTLVMGDVELEVGKPLPKYVLNAPVEVVLESIDKNKAVFSIVITDPNAANSDTRVKPEDFELKFEGLVPKVEQKSKYVLTPMGGGTDHSDGSTPATPPTPVGKSFY